MYAVIRTGGKQYKVAKDDVIVVETVPAEAGASVTLGEVLLVADGDRITTWQQLSRRLRARHHNVG